MIRKHPALATLAAMLLSSPAMAEEPSLLGPAGYPAHQCSKPTLPPAPTGVGGQGEVMMYNAQVRAFNQQIQIYTQCINSYMATANADIERIQARVNAAVTEANAR
jgi:hypothetical protein